MAERKVILGVQYLRGLAALGVVLCHYGSSLKNYPLLSKVFNYGQNGVHVFFLISGFIIVYSLKSANYKPSEFGRFLLKRSIRIDPSYIVTIILTLLLFQVLSFIPSFKGEHIPFIPGQFIAHVLYIVPFTSYPFYNHVFWTLCVEFQFYVLIGLLYFLINSDTGKRIFLLVFSLTCFLNLPNGYYLIFTYAPIFSLGILLVNLRERVVWSDCFLSLLIMGLIGYQFSFGLVVLISISCCVILFVKYFNKAFFFLGEISYSLYLTHGIMFIVSAGILKKLYANLSGHELLYLSLETCTAVLFAVVFYYCIERPCLKISKRISYKRKLQQANDATR